MYTSTNARTPHVRLKALRHSVDGLTQEMLARRCGISRVSVRSIETGRRRLTRSVANRISTATGVSPTWLMGYDGDDSHPLNFMQQPYASEDYRNKRRILQPGPMDPDGDTSSRIHDLAHELTTWLRAAHQEGRFGHAVCLFREMATEMAKTIGVKDINSRELDRLERFVFGDVGPYKSDPGGIDSLWRLVSPTGAIKWANAFRGTEDERDYFLTEIDQLRDLVSESFTVTSAAKRKSPPAPPRVRSDDPK
jgi:transcriptional regulator with XRE-family HTH domain